MRVLYRVDHFLMQKIVECRALALADIESTVRIRSLSLVL